MSEAFEDLLSELSADEFWRRAEALDRLRAERPSPDLLERLADALADAEAADRRNAARSALAGLASPEAEHPGAALETLTTLAARSPDADVRLLAAAALGESANPAAREALEESLRDADPNVAAGAAEALGMLGDPRAVEALDGALDSDPFWIRAAAVAALGRIGGTEAVDALAGAAEDGDLAPMVATALGEIGLGTGLPALGGILHRRPTSGDAVLGAAADILALNPGIEIPGWLRTAAASRVPILAERLATRGDVNAARLLGAAGTPESAQVLVRFLREEDSEETASPGIALLPRDVAQEAILPRLRDAGETELLTLLSVLPPLGDGTAARQVADHLAASGDAVRAAAAEALGRSTPEVVLSTILEAIRQPETRLAAIRAYARLGNPRCDPLEPLLSDPRPEIRAAAADGLARCGGAYEEQLRAALGLETNPGVKLALVRALGRAGGSPAARELAAMIDADDPAMRFAVVEALGRSGAPEAYAPLIESLVDPRPEIQAAALQALGALGDPRAAEPLAERLEHGSRDLRRTAAFALDSLAPPGAADRLGVALDDADREVRLTAVRLLARIGDDDSLSRIEAVADGDPDPLVRRAACDAADALRRRLREAS